MLIYMRLPRNNKAQRVRSRLNALPYRTGLILFLQAPLGFRPQLCSLLGCRYIAGTYAAAYFLAFVAL